jgi:hypothetical protein
VAVNIPQDRRHPGRVARRQAQGEIELESFSWGESNAGTTAAGRPRRGQGEHADLHVAKKLDKASPLLFLPAHGTALEEAILTARKAGKDSSNSSSSSSATCSCPRINGRRRRAHRTGLVQLQQDRDRVPAAEADGSLDAAGAGWDLKANKKV